LKTEPTTAETAAEREKGQIGDPRSGEIVKVGGAATQSRPNDRPAELEAAIANLTRLLARTDDPQTAAELVVGRRAMRSELEDARRQAVANVLDFSGERTRRRR
jgi:hypothetical protein